MIDISLVYCWLNHKFTSSSSFISSFSNMFLIAFLAALTIISWTPPKCGAAGGLNDLWTLLFVVVCLISSWSGWFTKFFNSYSTFTKLPPLPKNVVSGIPLWLSIFKNALKNESVSFLDDISKCIAWVLRQVNKHKYCFALLTLLPCILMNGPG